MPATVHAIRFADARAEAARRIADHELYEAELQRLRLKARERAAVREGFAVGLHQGFRAARPLTVVLSAIAGAALMHLVR